MIDFIVKYIKILLVYAMSAVQTILGWFMLSPWLWPTGSEGLPNGYIVGAVFFVLSCLFVLWLRVGEIEYLFYSILFEILLAPVAIVRTLVSLVAWIVRREAPELDFDYCHGLYDTALCFLFHIH